MLRADQWRLTGFLITMGRAINGLSSGANHEVCCRQVLGQSNLHRGRCRELPQSVSSWFLVGVKFAIKRLLGRHWYSGDVKRGVARPHIPSRHQQQDESVISELMPSRIRSALSRVAWTGSSIVAR
jgi:hypothetical protein